MLVLMTFTMMVAAPIMMVGGILMAVREDLGLSWLVAASVPVLFLAVGFIASRMVPGFRLMQTRIDAVNRVLREQITGIRVVRAFVREPIETERFARANDELTEVAVRTGRWMATMFPTVMLILNVSTVAVLWFGGHRVDAGEMQVGALTAFLAYLMQILMAVMMASFMLMMIPRAAVCADRIVEVLDTGTSRRAAGRPGAHRRRHRRGGPARRDLHAIPVPRRRCSATSTWWPVRGETARGHRLDRRRQDHAAQPRAPPLRRDRRRGHRGRRRRTPARPRPALGADRARPAEGLPVLRNGRRQPALRQPDATEEEMWEALEIAQARDFVEAMPGGLEAPGQPGRREPLRRPAPAARDRPRGDPHARDLPVRRLVLGARPGDGRAATGGARADHHRRRP